MPIHPTAIVAPEAQLGSGVSVGPYAIIEREVSIADGCVIGGHAQMLGRVELGRGSTIGPGAIIGGLPQDVSVSPTSASGIRIGRENVIREHVTIHRSLSAAEMTTLGDGNFLMVGAHVGHDCRVGDDNILANNCLLGGHVQIGNGAFLGGGAAFHQFVRVGDRSMVQGLSACAMDIPPYVNASGRNSVWGLNMTGLRRAGFDARARAEVKEIYHIFYREKLGKADAIAKAEQRSWGPEALRFLEFFQGATIRGICLRTR